MLHGSMDRRGLRPLLWSCVSVTLRPPGASQVRPGRHGSRDTFGYGTGADGGSTKTCVRRQRHDVTIHKTACVGEWLTACVVSATTHTQAET
eukprot:845553-Prymnesium_polylepis.1